MAQDKMSNLRIVTIGGSAGSLEVILQIINGIPRHPNAVFIIVVHRRNDKDSILENLLSYKTLLPVKEVEDKEPIVNNTIYLAPPDYHLLVESEKSFSLDSSEKIHFCRPSIDVTFESVSEVFHSNVIAVLLSGANADGARGLLVARKNGAHTLVQNPETAEVNFMPVQAVSMKAAIEVIDAENILQRILHILAV